MRRISIALLVLAAPLAASPPALALDHLQTVNELLVSNGGDQSTQFVELRATSPQPFPSPPYRIASYDATGAAVSSKDLSSTAMQMAGTNPYLVSTAAADAAFGVTGDEQLPANFLTAAGGKVCFEQGMGARQIACVSYGCPTGNPGAQYKAPADGESLQRQASGIYGLAVPTPKAANATAGSAACAGGGGGGGGGTTPDTTAPDQFLAFKKKQDVDKLAVNVTLNEAADVTIRGSTKVAVAAKTFRFKTVKRTLAANDKSKFRLRFGKKAKKAIRRALANGKKPKASVRIAATDDAGNDSLEKLKIRLTD